MKRVARNLDQLKALFRILQEIPEQGWLIQWTPYKPPRTLSQSKKLHAMMGDMAEFTGVTNMKGFIKTLEFWPTVGVLQFGVHRNAPKSEADLSKEEESEIIEALYALAAQHLEPLGFIWSEPV